MSRMVTTYVNRAAGWSSAQPCQRAYECTLTEVPRFVNRLLAGTGHFSGIFAVTVQPGGVKKPSQLNGYGYFSLYKRFGKDWEYINQKRLYALNDGEKVNVGSEVPTFVNYGLDLCSWNFTGAPGTYYISIDLTRDDGFTNGYFTISENEPTAINTPLAKPTGKTYYYDLNGHFLGTQEPQKGVFVVKGKKVVK